MDAILDASVIIEIFRELKSDGKVPKVKDLLISVSAIAHDLRLITVDRDFELFRKFGLKVQYI
ncbi:PIN domain-containing protein [Ferroglobus placidus]|uniref:PIN domain nuclease n=1 Tax=Ferroglobus placidus TaxID=54261 RepID=UPI0001B776DF|nr:PIN domain nuclease [Ferroglobus placidus]